MGRELISHMGWDDWVAGHAGSIIYQINDNADDFSPLPSTVHAYLDVG